MNTRRTGEHASFGSWLALQLDHAGLSPSQFAKRVGVSHVTVGRWVKGRTPDAKYIDAIADVLLLDYDLVAERAGYRPKMPRDRLEDLHARFDKHLLKLSEEDLAYLERQVTWMARDATSTRGEPQHDEPTPSFPRIEDSPSEDR